MARGKSAFLIEINPQPKMAAHTFLPEQGVTYFEVPAEYHVTGYRYTYVNEHPGLVEPRTRRVVQIID